MKRAKKSTRNSKIKSGESINSKYGRKVKYLKNHGGMAKDYPTKPWK